jgi:hypothetical protein
MLYREENPWYTMNRRVVGFQGWSGRFYKTENPLAHAGI